VVVNRSHREQLAWFDGKWCQRMSEESNEYVDDCSKTDSKVDAYTFEV
jgi:hypothetical protein